MYYMNLLWISATAVATATATKVITISNGKIQGSLRLEAPQPFASSFNGTLNATNPVPGCVRFGGGSAFIGSEDCLYLNVFTPANATASSRLPVKVWVYRGAFLQGTASDPLYSGCYSSADAVVVTLNYRLGPLGYLAVENTTITGNYGALDQLQGLSWVQEDIAAFGGDPEQVLLFGQSAGAIGTFALATLPEIKFLVKAASFESSGGVELPTVSSAQQFHAEFVDCMRSKTPETLNATFNALPKNKRVIAYTLDDFQGAGFPWSPLVGSAPFPIQPADAGDQVPAKFGSNGLEGSVFVLQDVGLAGAEDLTSEDYDYFLAVNSGAWTDAVAQQYPLSSFPNSSVSYAIIIIMCDYTFRCPAYRSASLAASKGLPVWTYDFNQTPSCPQAAGEPLNVLQLLGATHAAEIPFVFGEVAGLPLPDPNCSFNAGEQKVSAYMETAWTAMAQNASPGSAWPRFAPNSSLGVNFENDDVTPGVVDYSMCAFWDRIATAVDSAAVNGSDARTGAANASSTGVAPATSAGRTAAASNMFILSISAVLMGGILFAYCL